MGVFLISANWFIFDTIKANMKKKLLTILAIVSVTMAGCKKDASTEQEIPLSLTGTIWYGKSDLSILNGLTYYDHLDFKTSTDVDIYQSDVIGKATDNYIGHLKYTIMPSDINLQTITIVGKGRFGEEINSTLTYNKKFSLINWGDDDDYYTKYK